jgi:hypothetical protein
LKIYLSAAWTRRPELQRYAEELRAMGHEVTASWLSVAPDWTADDGHRMQAPPATRAALIARDLADVAGGAVFVAFAEPEGSPYVRGTRHGELGAALAWEKTVLLVGEREENLLHWHERVRQFGTWGECRVFLCRLLGEER